MALSVITWLNDGPFTEMKKTGLEGGLRIQFGACSV